MNAFGALDIEKNIIGNSQLRRKLRSKRSEFSCGKTLALVGETLICKDYGVMEESAAFDWLFNREWTWIFRQMERTDFVKRFVLESNAPEIYKAYLLARNLSFCARYLFGDFDYPPLQWNDFDLALLNQVREIDQMSASEGLLRLGISGVKVDQKLVEILMDQYRWDIIGLLLERADGMLLDCSTSELVELTVLHISRSMAERDVECNRDGADPVDEHTFLPGLKLMHRYFSGELDRACKVLVSDSELMTRDRIYPELCLTCSEDGQLRIREVVRRLMRNGH